MAACESAEVPCTVYVFYGFCLFTPVKSTRTNQHGWFAWPFADFLVTLLFSSREVFVKIFQQGPRYSSKHVVKSRHKKCPNRNLLGISDSFHKIARDRPTGGLNGMFDGSTCLCLPGCCCGYPNSQGLLTNWQVGGPINNLRFWPFLSISAGKCVST